MAVVAKVWIDEDCITCDACQDICPEVFEVNDDSSMILAAVRTDGAFDRNVGGSPLVGNLGTELGDSSSKPQRPVLLRSSSTNWSATRPLKKWLKPHLLL